MIVLRKQSYVILSYVFLTPLVLILLVDLIIGDYELFILINQRMVNAFLDFACVYLSPIFFFTFYLLTLAVLYIEREGSSIAGGITSLLTGPLSYGIGSVIKFLVGRPRPFNVLPDVRVIGLFHASSFSFPSTTTMLVFGFTLPILFENYRYGIILVAMSYFIGFSVVYTGYHFLGDVVAGILLSLAITYFTNKMKKPIENFLKKQKVD